MSDKPKIDALLAAPLPGQSYRATREQIDASSTSLAAFAAWSSQVAG